MSPEQVRSSQDVDARTDFWALGVILYRLLTATPAFDADTLGGVLASILEDTPKPLRELRPDAPEGLEQVITRCLAKNREERWPNVHELADALLPFAPAEASSRAEHVRRHLGVPASTAAKSVSAPAASENGAPAIEAKVQKPRSIEQTAASAGGGAVAPAPAATAVGVPSSGAGAPQPARSRAPLMIGGLMVVVGAGVGAYFALGKKTPALTPPAASVAQTASTKAATGAPAVPTVRPSSLAASERTRTKKPTRVTLDEAKAAEEKAIKLHRESCKDNDSATDCKKYLELLTAGCDKNDGDRCNELGDLLIDGAKGVPEDDKASTKAYLKSCEVGTLNGCTGAGLAYAKGWGTEVDEARAKELYEKACSGKSPDGDGCRHLGDLYQKGHGVPADSAKAAQLYELGCQAEEPKACGALGKKLVEGDGIATDRARGIGLLEQACKDDDKASCDEVLELRKKH